MALVLLLGAPAFALAHPGRAPEPHDAWAAWSLDPLVFLGIGAAALAYRRGIRALWGRAGHGRGIREWQARAYLAGLLALLLALVTPVDGLGSALFSAHMVQHLILVLVAAPLIAMGAPLLAFVWALPRSARRRLRGALRKGPALRGGFRALTHPLSAWALHATALWAWHLPSLYDLAVRDDLVHGVEHLTFLATGVLFWWVVLPRGGALRAAPGLAVLYVAAFGMQSGILGALLTLGTRPWYSAYQSTTAAWGLSPLEDQQLGGALMWVPGSLAYLAAIVALLLLLLRRSERRAEHRPAHLPALIR